MTDSSEIPEVVAESGSEENSSAPTTTASEHTSSPTSGNLIDNFVSSYTRPSITDPLRSVAGVGVQGPLNSQQRVIGEEAPSENLAVGTARILRNYVAVGVTTEVPTSTEALSPPPQATSTTANSSTTGTDTISARENLGDRVASPQALPTTLAAEHTDPTIISSSSTSPMSGNSEYHSSSRPSSGSGPSNNNSSSRRPRNGLFGINLDLNFDPSSWLVPSNVAGRSISSLSVLPDWVRHPTSIIPNRSGDSSNSNTQSSSGVSEGRQSQQHYLLHQYGPGTGGAASRLVSHQQPSQNNGAGTSWNSSSFQSSSSIPSNMHHHSVPLRTRHVTTMRSVDEDLDADYNPVSAIDISATGRDHRGDSHSYVIDMDSPMGGWTEDDNTSPSQPLRGASSSGGGLNHSHNSTSSPGDGIHNNTGSASVGSEGEPGSNRRGIFSEVGLPSGGGIPGQGIPGVPGQPGGDPNSPSMADAATGANERTRAAEILRDAPETRAFINEISRYTTIRPFIVINFLKGVFDHGTSILAFLALVVTFSHANSMVKKEVSKQRKRNLLYLTMIVINLMACVAFIYYIFNEMELYYALVFMPTRSDLSAFWSLMWAVGVTDYVAKFGTVLVKIVVVSLPGCILPFQKRGKFYLFIEYSSQLYRSFLPVYPWLFYLVSAYEGTVRLFGLLLAGIYVLFKITDSVKRFKDWLKALEKLLSNVHYGTNPTAKQLDGAGTICPICHDNFANPTRLQCSHIFCEECVATWFDRERTCPMCRAKVVDDPTYRDGSTSQYIQLF